MIDWSPAAVARSDGHLQFYKESSDEAIYSTEKLGEALHMSWHESGEQLVYCTSDGMVSVIYI